MTKILSPRDSRMEAIHALSRRSERDHSGLFWTEGLRFVARAMQHPISVERVLYVPKMLTHPFAAKLLQQCHEKGILCWEVTPEVFLQLSRAQEPQWIGAVARQCWTRLADAPADAGLCWLALDTVQSPGNFGSIARTCEAVGAAGIILLGAQADPYDPAAVRGSMGALFSLRFARATWAEFAVWKRRHGCLLVGTSPQGKADYRDARYPPPTVLWMGWERKGLSREQQALCDVTARIPMVGATDSLNLAVATGVMLYEIFSQRKGR